MHDIIECSAVVASAVYGVLLARRHHLDFVGIFSLAFIAAFGGGTLRDLFLDRHPLFWIREHHYPVIVFVIALVTSVVRRIPERTESFLQFPDALGLGLFTVSGTDAALSAGTSYFVASLLGAVTGTFGGVIGDVICNRVPSLFRPAPMFATCSFTGAWVYLGLTACSIPQAYAASTAIVFIVAFRLAAIHYNWMLPHVGDEPTDEPGSRVQ